MSSRIVRFAQASAALVALAALGVAPASAAQYRSLAQRTATLTAAEASARLCASGPADGASVDKVTFTAPAQGYLTAALRGGAGSDWDLGLVDAASGDHLNGAASLGANERTTAWLREGQEVSVQACRHEGAASVPLTLDFTEVTFSASEEAQKLQLVRVALPREGDAGRLQALGLDTTDHAGPGYQDVLLHSDADAQALRDAGFAYDVRVADVVEQDRQDRAVEKAAASSRRARLAARAIPSGRTSYRTLAEIQDELRRQAAENPGFVRLFSVGKTFEGRDILGMEIATDVTRTDDGRPTYVQIGTHHAREWPANEATLEFGLELINGFKAGDARLSRIVREARTLVIPVLNVDGFDATIVSERATLANPANQSNTYINQGRGAYKRKTCTTGDPVTEAIPCAVRANGDTAAFRDTGVDPNRNYGVDWGGPGTSSQRLSLVYHGPAPWSEIETDSFRRFIRDRQPTVLITNHTYSGLLLRPPGLSDFGPAPDEDRLRTLGDAMALQTNYLSQFSYQLYDTTGTTDDYLYFGLNSFSYTPEIGKEGFHPAYTTGFIPEYDGQPEVDDNGNPTGRKLGGLREAYTLAGEAAIEADTHSILEGTAPAGRTLRISRTFTYQTSRRPNDNGVQNPVQTITEPRQTDLTVPADGRFTWHVNPSRQPRDAGPGIWTLRCLDEGGNELERRDVTVERGQRLNLALTCGAGSTAAAPTPTQTTPPRACAVPDGFRFVSASRRGRGLRIRFSRKVANPVTIDVFQVRKGQRVQRKRVARFAARKAGFTWSGRFRSGPQKGRYVSNGSYYVRFSIKDAAGRSDVRRVTTERTRGTFRRQPAFFLKDACA